jgi:hypothetical protein
MEMRHPLDKIRRADNRRFFTGFAVFFAVLALIAFAVFALFFSGW